jgi:hypothetical protein
LFIAATFLGILSIRENCLDDITMMALACVATSATFGQMYPGFDPVSFSGIRFPDLFFVLWKLHTMCDSTLLPQTLAAIQDPEFGVQDVPEEMWIGFVLELSLVGQQNFTKVLEEVRPIPLNISQSLDGLPYFQWGM